MDGWKLMMAAEAHLSPLLCVATLKVLDVWPAQPRDGQHLLRRVHARHLAVPRGREADTRGQVDHCRVGRKLGVVKELPSVGAFVGKVVDGGGCDRHYQCVKQAAPSCAVGKVAMGVGLMSYGRVEHGGARKAAVGDEPRLPKL